MSNNTRRGYFPNDVKGQLAWANNHLTGLAQLAGVFDVSAAFLTAARADLQHMENFCAWRDQAAELAREYTQAIERAEWDFAGDPVVTQPHDPATLGIDKTVTIVAGWTRREGGGGGSSSLPSPAEERRSSIGSSRNRLGTGCP